MLTQIGVDVDAAAPVGHVQQPQIVPALLLGGEFAVDLEALLAQPLPGPPQFDGGVLLVQAQQAAGMASGSASTSVCQSRQRADWGSRWKAPDSIRRFAGGSRRAETRSPRLRF